MARAIAGQVRPVLLVWLLVTLPAVCHHETAVLLLGTLLTGQDYQHLAASQGSQHGHLGHLQVPDHDLADDAPRHGQRPTGPEWCADHALGASGALADGQTIVAWSAADALLPAAAPPSGHPWLALAAPLSLAQPPPSPPPRLLA